MKQTPIPMWKCAACGAHNDPKISVCLCSVHRTVPQDLNQRKYESPRPAQSARTYTFKTAHQTTTGINDVVFVDEPNVLYVDGCSTGCVVTGATITLHYWQR